MNIKLKLITLLSLAPVALIPLVSTTEVSLSNSNEGHNAKVDIATIFNADASGNLTYTQSTSFFSAPSKTDILSFLSSCISDHQYDDVINSLAIPDYASTAQQVTISAKNYSKKYNGSVNVN
jgi:hypothetical protein